LTSQIYLLLPEIKNHTISSHVNSADGRSYRLGPFDCYYCRWHGTCTPRRKLGCTGSNSFCRVYVRSVDAADSVDFGGCVCMVCHRQWIFQRTFLCATDLGSDVWRLRCLAHRRYLQLLRVYRSDVASKLRPVCNHHQPSRRTSAARWLAPVYRC